MPHSKMLFGTFDFASLLPSDYRASASLILQTALVLFIIYVITKVIGFIRYRLQVERLFGDLPGPKERHWLRGSFIAVSDDVHERLMTFVKWGNTYSKEKGFIRIWWFFCYPMLMACHPYSMRKILKTAEPKPKNLVSGYRPLERWLGDGLLLSGGKKWARNRRLLTPAFHFDILKPYINVYNDSANVFKSNLETFAARNEKFELFQNVCKCTLDIILRCAFSYETDVQKSGESHPYVLAVNRLAITNFKRMRHPLLIPDFTFNWSEMGRIYKQDCDFVHSVADDIIHKRKEVLAKTGGAGDSRYLDFLDILLTAKDENGTGLSDIEIRNEVDTFLFEGHDTTASAISWILYSLAEHPEYQQRCQEEIDAILEGRDSDDIEWGDLPKFEFLTMCIKEGMRLHTPVGEIARVTTEDFKMGGRVFPPGVFIWVNIWMLHHNEEVWGADHMEFKPDRFTKDNIAKMDPYQFVPFSGGPRNCIGQNFAMNEEKVVLAKLLHNFRFKLVPGHVVRKHLAAVMRAENGIMMTVERRRH